MTRTFITNYFLAGAPAKSGTLTTTFTTSLVLTLLVVSSSAGQINVSETFQKTLKKMAKEKVKAEVISWVTDQDPTKGIIARDLIAQVLDGKDEATLSRSTTNVVTTMMFIGGIKRHVEALVDSTAGILEQAKAAGWTRGQLIAYSSLYYFFSERLKYNLYVSPEILKMSEEKSRIESFTSGENRKWTVIVSGELVGIRRKDNDLSVDVRALEVLDKAIWLLISDRARFVSHSDSVFHSFAKAFESDKSFSQAIEAFKQSTKPGRIIEDLFGVYQKAYEKSYQVDKIFNVTQRESSSDGSTQANSLVRAFSNILAIAHYEFVDHEQARSAILGIIRDLFEYWIAQSRRDGWKVDYVFSLAGTGIVSKDNPSVDFTILDQIRFVRHFETTRIFLYFGGFFDPLFKSTLNKTGAKIYLTGLGFGWQSAYFTVSAGVEYPEVRIGHTRLAVTLGYEIPISEIID